MMNNRSYPIPNNEISRLKALQEYKVMDTLPEQAYDNFTKLASIICNTPIALITLLDEERQWFKSRIGLERSEIPREDALCNHAIMMPEDILVVNDAAQDGRFASKPLVAAEPNIRFYAGAPLVTSNGEALGTICVMDDKPRGITQEQLDALQVLSREVMGQFELRRSIATLEQAMLKQEDYIDQLQEYQRELEKVRAELENQSLTDPLTGVNNRRAFDTRFEEEFLRAKRYKVACSLILIDVDHFKLYNDSFGHTVGDEALIAVAALLKEDVRMHDMVARYGGEEFAIILPNTDIKGAMVMGERFRRSIQRASWKHKQLTISVGVASLQENMQKPMELLRESDTALYNAKQAGRNLVIGPELNRD
jgi:diguanylate cyclase (GGDEF)-like protein